MKKGRLLANAYLVLVFGFLYVPIAVLIAFSFNESKSRTVFTGFTFKWYQNLFHNDMVLKSLGVSLGVAFAAACIATVVGTLAAIGINTDFKALCKSGAKPMLHGFIISLLVVLVAIGVEYMLGIAPTGTLA